MLLGTVLVLLGSLAHAGWNVLVKRASVTGTSFVWLYSALITPVLAVMLASRALSEGSTAFSDAWAAVVSAGLHTAYALVLQRSYAVGDLGVVYPVARAGAPILVALAAVPMFGGATGPALWIGIALIGIGVPLLVGRRAQSRRAGLTGAVAGGATALTIAAYTLWDGYAVARLNVDVMSYLALTSLVQFAVLTVVVAVKPGRPGDVVRSHWRLALPVALLVPTSYGLVLAALEHADVQVVAAMRSASILAAAVLGWWLLGEPRSPRRMVGAVVLTAGVAAAALGS